MADEDGAGEEGALQRWSRRKAEARTAEGAEVPAPVEPAEPEPVDPADLPDVETLDASSDFTVFMREGVPEPLRRLALRKLWRLDPVLANVDGLVDYGEDFTDLGSVIDGVKSAYQAGKGYVTDDKAPAAQAPPQPAADPAADPAEDPPDQVAEDAADDLDEAEDEQDG